MHHIFQELLVRDLTFISIHDSTVSQHGILSKHLYSSDDSVNLLNNNEVMKLPSTGIVKYHVKLKFEVDGLVEKADIIGAIFGQTEGLLGPEMNLNELQKVSKVGRIEVNVDTRSNMAKGDALIPMSTDISTAPHL